MQAQAIEAAICDEYCASPWNLSNLPKLQGSTLQAVHRSTAIITVPYDFILE